MLPLLAGRVCREHSARLAQVGKPFRQGAQSICHLEILRLG